MARGRIRPSLGVGAERDVSRYDSTRQARVYWRYGGRAIHGVTSIDSDTEGRVR